jgi:AcrR family transcriptional regulator
MVTTQKTAARDHVREGLLDAMDRLLARFGYQKTTVDDLATEAGIGKGTVYLYFSSKEQVALSCIDRLHERLMAEISEIAESDASAKDKITQILRARVMTRFDYCRNATCLDEMLAALHKELMVRKERYHTEEARLLQSILDEAAADGELPACCSCEAAESMILATNALLPYSLKTSQLGSYEEIEEKVRRVAALLVLGLSGLPRNDRDN